MSVDDEFAAMKSHSIAVASYVPPKKPKLPERLDLDKLSPTKLLAVAKRLPEGSREDRAGRPRFDGGLGNRRAGQEVEMDRRSFLRGLFAAPAIIAADRLMPVKLFEPLYPPILVPLLRVPPSPLDAGVFYCPHIPLQVVTSMGNRPFDPWQVHDRVMKPIFSGGRLFTRYGVTDGQA